jgi:magnesium transporter
VAALSSDYNAGDQMKHFAIGEAGVVETANGPGQIVLATGPEDEDRTLLQEQFGLDDYDLASTVDADEVPRLEASGDRMLLIWKVPESASFAETVELGVSVTGVCLTRDRIAFVRSSSELSFTEREFRGVRDVRDVLLAFLQSTVRHFVGHLRVIPQLTGALEKKITVSMENKHLLQMFSLSESLVYYQDAIEGNNTVLSKLRNTAAQHGFGARQLELLDDIVLENAQAARQASIFSSVLSGLMDARGTVVNNNMNVLLKNLTLINIIFLPLNLIASIGGMSEWSMMTRGLRWPVSYALFIFGMVGIGWGTWIVMNQVIDRRAARTRGENGKSFVDRRPTGRGA